MSETTLRITEGESATYRVRLTKPLPFDENGMRVGGWWVMAQVDGATRIDGFYDAGGDEDDDISWVPSVGWEFNSSDWPEGQDESEWREFTIRALEDNDDTEDQTVTFSHEVWDQDAYCPDALHPDRLPVVTVHITDNDGPVSVPALSIADAAPVVEGVTSRFEVTLSASSAQLVTVVYATADGTAEEGADYRAVTGRTLRFEAGETAKTIEVETVDDGTQESTENFGVKLSNPNGATLSDDEGTGTITDNDGSVSVPALSIADAAPVVEGVTSRFEVTLSASSAQLVTVVYATADGTAVEGADYTAVTGRTLRFEAGETAKTIEVETVDDGTQESTENFRVKLSNPNGATLSDDEGTGTITDNDGSVSVPALSIADAAPVVEGVTSRFEVTLSASSAQLVTVAYATADGTAVEGADYTAVTERTLRFEAGETAKTIEVETVDDGTQESTENFGVKLSNPNGATLSDDEGTGTITDNDGSVSVPALSIADAAPVVEGVTSRFEVTLSASSAQLVTVVYATADGTAVEGADYTAVTERTLRFEAGETAKTIEVETVDDGTQESTENFRVKLSNPAGATLSDDEGTGTITDNDGSVRVPALSIADAAPVVEGVTSRFEVTLSASSAQLVTVVYATADGTAVEGADYTAAGRTLRFEAGETAKTIEVGTVDDGTQESTENFRVKLSNPAGATLSDDEGTGTITDNDGSVSIPALSIADAAPVVEGVTSRFEVTLSASSAQLVTVVYATADGTAVEGADYTAVTGRTLRFEAGETAKTIEVETVDDGTQESTENFGVKLSNPNGATLSDDEGTGTITDNDGSVSVPALSIADAAPVVEGVTSRFEVTLSASSAQLVTVVYATADGTAVEGADYTAVTERTLRFEAGETAKTIEVETVDDGTQESTENFRVKLSNPAGATLSDDEGTGTITDNDGSVSVPALSIADAAPVVEGVTSRFEVTLSASSAQLVTVVYATADGTAVEGADYTAVTERTLRFEAGETAKTIEVETVDDGTQESTENFGVKLSNPNGATLSDDEGTGTITDNDGSVSVPALSIADAAPVVEGVTSRFEVTLSASSAQLVTVAYATADGTAVEGADYTAVTERTLRFEAGETAKTIEVETVDDGTQESTENFGVKLSNPNGATLSDDEGTGTITDNDGSVSVPALSIADAAPVVEGVTSRFEVTLSASSAQLVTVVYATADGTAVEGADYTAVTERTLRFEAGETAKTIEVETVDDGTQESTENFRVKLSNPAGATLSDDEGTGTITDNDGSVSVPALSIADAAPVVEGGTSRFEVTLSASSAQVVTVVYATADGTAVEGADYTGVTGTLRFEAGETAKTIEVATVDDGTQESTENFGVKLSNPNGATLSDDEGTGTITDDDAPPELVIDDAPPVSEGETAEFTVRLSAASGVAVTVSYRTVDGTAVEGADYTGVTGTLRFEPGETAKTIEVATVDDGTRESTENFGVKLSNPNGATLSDDEGTGTITDDDAPPELVIDDAPPVSEGETAEFTVRLSAASGVAVTVSYRTVDGTAVEGADYTGVTGTLRFEAGETAKTIEVATVDDGTQESTENFGVKLSNPNGATLSDDEGTGTITDDDAPPELVIDDAPPVSEGETAEFTVRLSAASGVAVTVSYRTVDGTAVEGADYTGVTGTLRFEAGETAKTIEVATVDDGTRESTENFGVKLSNPNGATLSDDEGTGTITDDDAPPELVIDDAPPVSEGETAEFTVRLSAASGVAVTVSYRTVDGTAVAGSDYTSTSGALRFDPGETTHTIAVPLLEDESAEAEEVFTVELSAPSGATLTDGTGTGTITDDDAPPELVIDDAPPVSEGETAEFTVRLSAASGVAVTVSYRTVDGTAVAGSDYTSTSGTLRFDPGTTTRAVGVATLTDDSVEGAERFTVELSGPERATIAEGTAVGTITDEAERRVELVNRTVLPELGRALAFTAVSCRFGRALTGQTARGGLERSIGYLSLSHAWTADRRTSPANESLTVERALGDSSFLMPSREEEGGPGRFAAWGCGDYRNLAGGGDNGALAWDGDVFSVHLGADVRLGSGVRAGMSLSRSRGSFDYYSGGRSGGGGGAYNLRLTGVHPYLAWSMSPDLDVWGTVGHAWGQLRIVDDGGPLMSAATLDSGVVGVSARLLARGTTTLKLKGEGALAQLDVAGAGAMLEAVTVDMRRVRLSTEAGHEHVFPSGGSLTPWAEVGLRHDGGDGETGAGLEVGGGLRYLNPEAGWTTEGYGRWLAVHEGSLREWGVGAQIRFDPGASGRGPSVSLTPGWGDTASGVHRLWERGATGATVPGAPDARLDAQFGYGFAALRGRGVLTPFGVVSLAREYGRSYRLGGHLAVGRSATLSLEAERRERAAVAAVHAVMVRGVLRF